MGQPAFCDLKDLGVTGNLMSKAAGLHIFRHNTLQFSTSKHHPRCLSWPQQQPQPLAARQNFCRIHSVLRTCIGCYLVGSGAGKVPKRLRANCLGVWEDGLGAGIPGLSQRVLGSLGLGYCLCTERLTALFLRI